MIIYFIVEEYLNQPNLQPYQVFPRSIPKTAVPVKVVYSTNYLLYTLLKKAGDQDSIDDYFQIIIDNLALCYEDGNVYLGDAGSDRRIMSTKVGLLALSLQ